jgi:hypothetical protein
MEKQVEIAFHLWMEVAESIEIDPRLDDIDEITENEKRRFQCEIREMFDNHRCEVSFRN